MKYGRLTVLEQRRRPGIHPRLFVLCDCGIEKEVDRQAVLKGRTRSCGCLEREARFTSSKTHGMSRTRTYETWLAMIKRCSRTDDAAYPQYGGRGITVCERWLTFENFLADMGERPPGTSIERTNNDGPYSPDNCCWATRAQQARNTARTIRITVDGETLCLTDWAARAKRKYSTLYAAHRRGEDLVAILKRSMREAS